MQDKNIFVVGPEVKGDSQIGYQRYIEKFSDILTNTVNNISITGIKRFGKTSLAKEVLARVKQQLGTSVITIFINLAKQQSFADLLASIVHVLQDETIENDAIMNDRIYNHYMEKLEAADPASKMYRDNIESIFEWLAKQGYRIILAIDEFDAASAMFPSKAEFEFLRDLSSNRDIGISLVLVSRRQLYMIEKRNFNNSTFHGVVQTYPVEGFNDEDLSLYFDTLKTLYGIEPGDYTKERLDYYCGRSPYLLSMFAYDIVDSCLKGKPYNVDEIYRDRQIDIENYYKSIFACLNNDKISVDGAYEETCTIEKLIGVIVGPKMGIVEEDIHLLEHMGYLRHDGDVYESISKHFTNALKRVPIRVDTWDSILAVEKKLKVMIRNQIRKNRNVEYIDYDLWAEIFERIGAAGMLDTYDKFVTDSMQEYQTYADLMDVCSLDVAVSILEFFWEDWFSAFFNHDPWNKWEAKLRLCASARNPIAHGHEEFLSPEDKASVNSYCTEILKQLADSGACVDPGTEIKKEANIRKINARNNYYRLTYQPADPLLLRKTVTLTAAEQTNKGIKCWFQTAGKYYHCLVGKQKWLDKFPNVPLSNHLGLEFAGKVATVNEFQNAITVDLI